MNCKGQAGFLVQEVGGRLSFQAEITSKMTQYVPVLKKGTVYLNHWMLKCRIKAILYE